MKTTRRSDSILYKRWYQFATGTTNPNCYAWAAYGALGIKMKKSWTPFKSGFDQFEQSTFSTELTLVKISNPVIYSGPQDNSRAITEKLI